MQIQPLRDHVCHDAGRHLHQAGGTSPSQGNAGGTKNGPASTTNTVPPEQNVGYRHLLATGGEPSPQSLLLCAWLSEQLIEFHQNAELPLCFPCRSPPAAASQRSLRGH
jgi:hypothetical protein